MTVEPHPRKVYAVLVNWNGWRNTICCLESLLRSEHENYEVVICDNASENDSLAMLKAWASGAQPSDTPSPPQIRSLVEPPLPKPIPIVEYDRAEAEQGGSLNCRSAPLVLIKTGANLGFGGGNNVGIRYALARGDCDFVWCLNNDTVVPPNAMSAMVQRLGQKTGSGICGSTIVFLQDPQRVQAFGGCRYFPWAGISMSVGRIFGRLRQLPPERIERKMDYVMGASMMVTRSFIEQVGLLSEDYFLYFEEFDWVQRAAKEFTLAYAPSSIVYHKAGASIGSNRKLSARSNLSDFYLHRNALMISKRYFKFWTPIVRLRFALSAALGIFTGDRRRAIMLWDLATTREPELRNIA